MKKIALFLLFTFGLMQAPSARPVSGFAPNHPQPQLTLRLSDDAAHPSKTPLLLASTEYESGILPETKSDKRHAIWVGALLGVLVVAGVVVPIVVLK